jgi:hypothetical protein
MLEILDAAAFSSSRSSKANGLCCAVPAIFGANVAEMSADFNPFGYRSSNRSLVAMQSGPNTSKVSASGTAGTIRDEDAEEYNRRHADRDDEADEASKAA